jgi:hypothetical protein
MHRVAGLHGGDCVPLTLEEFQNAYATFLAVQSGELPSDPLPKEYFNAPSGEVKAIEATPFSCRADGGRRLIAWAAARRFL